MVRIRITVLQVIFSFWSVEISEDILRNLIYYRSSFIFLPMLKYLVPFR